MQNIQQNYSAADDDDDNADEDDDDDDDDIERDPAAEIIKPSFRRHAVVNSQKKIKVKLQRDGHNRTSAEIDTQKAKRNSARSYYANRILT